MSSKYVASGLFFHTNSEETFYTFRRHHDSDIIEMEMALCPGLYEVSASYQELYHYTRAFRIYICKKYDDFIQNPILCLLYKLSLILSQPCINKLRTRIIWKCLRLSNDYEEFELDDIKKEQIEICEWYSSTHAEDIISQNRLEKVFELACSVIIEEHERILIDINNYLEDIEYQEQLYTIVNKLRKTELTDNALEVVGKFL